jgi:hypothetical protein
MASGGGSLSSSRPLTESSTTFHPDAPGRISFLQGPDRQRGVVSMCQTVNRRGVTEKNHPLVRRDLRAATLPRSQRCAVRVTYASNSVRGQRRAHGRYVARESAATEPTAAGFDQGTLASIWRQGTILRKPARAGSSGRSSFRQSSVSVWICPCCASSATWDEAGV